MFTDDFTILHTQTVTLQKIYDQWESKSEISQSIFRFLALSIQLCNEIGHCLEELSIIGMN